MMYESVKQKKIIGTDKYMTLPLTGAPGSLHLL